MRSRLSTIGTHCGTVGLVRTVILGLLTVSVGLGAEAPARHGSLYQMTRRRVEQRRKEARKGLRVDPPGVIQLSWTAVEAPKPRKFQPEDLVTIIVREEVRSTSDAKSKQEREYTIDSKLDEWIRLSHWKLWRDVVSDRKPAVKLNIDTDADNRGKADRRDKVTTRVQARVVDVKPNGNLTLEATKVVETEEDQYTLKLTGMCRTVDVTPDNTVLSTQIYKLRFSKVSIGATKDGTKQGWLTRWFEKIRPI